jgi:hypothetical protein
MARTISVHDVDGFSKQYGIEDLGSTWTDFEDRFLSEDGPEVCGICGKPIDSGWLCHGCGGEEEVIDEEEETDED